MSSLSVFFFSYLANAVWEVALIVAAGWLVSRFVKRLGPRLEHSLWASTLTIAVVTPALPFLRALAASLIASQVADRHSSMILVNAQALPNSRPAFLLPEAVLWSLVAIYVAVILCFAGRLIASLHGAAALVRKAAPATLTPEQVEIWRGCKRSFALGNAQILASPRVSGPVALGLLKPVLLLPPGFAAQCAPVDFLAAVAHECAHLKRRDFQKNLFYEAVSLPLVFHPLIWVLKSQIGQTREMACDDSVTERQMDPRSYSKALLRLATMVALAARVPAIHPMGIFDANILEKRIMRISTKKHPAGALLRYGVLVPAALLLLSVALSSAAMAVVIEPQTAVQNAAQDSHHGPVYKVGKDVSPPVVIHSVDAQFSDEARRAKYQGVCVISLIVDAQGNPQNIRIARSLGMGLDEKAIEAIRQYRFKPAIHRGKPVAVAIKIEVDFMLYSKNGRADGGGGSSASAPPPPPQ